MAAVMLPGSPSHVCFAGCQMASSREQVWGREGEWTGSQGSLRFGRELQVRARSKHSPAAPKLGTRALRAPLWAMLSAPLGETGILARLNLWEVHTSPTSYRGALW